MTRADAWTRLLPGGLRSRIEGSALLRQVLPNTGWLAGDRLVRMILSVLVGAWVARYLGPADYGALSFALAWVALFMGFGALAHERIVVRELVEHPEREPETLGSATALRFAGGLVAIAAAIVGVWMLRPGDHEALVLVAIAAGAMVQPFAMIELWYQARVRARQVAPAMIVAALLSAGLKVALILARAPLVAFAWAFLAEGLITGVLVALVYETREHGLATWRTRMATCRALLRDSWPLVLSGAMILVYMRIDQVMLRQMASPAELGAYAAAVKLVEGWYFLPTAVVASLFPSIVQARQQDDALFLARLQKLYGLMAAAAYAVAIPTTLLAPWIVRVLYGPGYAAAAPMLAVLVWSLVFTNLGIARGAFLTSMNWTRPYLMTVALGGAVNVALNLVLIPRWGGMGAVVATLIAYGVATLGSCFAYRPLFRTGRMLARAMLFPRF
ncbi:MAG TPA: flippase [Candidatus Eisenbacteria bacterium]|nr:flippase [Candidatus Eisenbacteria bacterium]